MYGQYIVALGITIDFRSNDTRRIDTPIFFDSGDKINMPVHVHTP